jgi:hypothetical protein
MPNAFNIKRLAKFGLHQRQEGNFLIYISAIIGVGFNPMSMK